MSNLVVSITSGVINTLQAKIQKTGEGKFPFKSNLKSFKIMVSNNYTSLKKTHKTSKYHNNPFYFLIFFSSYVFRISKVDTRFKTTRKSTIV
jgi:hypothetical protein